LTFYQTLLVSPTASAAEIKAAHRKLAIRFHPDKLAAAATTMQSSNNSLTSSASSPHLHVLQGAAPLPNDVSSNGNGVGWTHHPLLHPMAFNGVLSASDAQALFISIQEAYECLRNPLERKRYDAALRRGIRYKKLPSVSVDDAVPGWDGNNTRVPTPSSAERTDFSSSSSFSATSWYPFAASTAPGTAASSRTSTRRNSRVNNNPCGASSVASPDSSVAPDSASSTTTDFNNAEWGSSSVNSSARSSRRNSLIKPAARVLLVPVALLSACVFVLVLQPLEFVRAALASRLRVFLPLPTGGKAAAASSRGGMLRRVADVVLVYLCVLLYGPVQALLLFRAVKKLIRRAVRRAVLGSTDEDAATSPYTSAPPPTSAAASTAGTLKTADAASSVDATTPAAVAADSTSTPTKQQETVFREPVTLRRPSPRPSVQLQPEESSQSEQSTQSTEQPRPLSPLQFSDSDSSPVLASRRVTQLQQQPRDFLKHRGPSSRRMDTASTSPSSSGSASPAGGMSVSASMASLEEAVAAEASGNDDAAAAAEAGGAD
jgi:curved DNA-binding protein CbpA